MPERAVVIIPTYNEASNVGQIVPQVLEQDERLDVLVVDDNSPDGTGDIADTLAADSDTISVHHREGKLGLGTATIAAMRYAIEQGYDYLLNLDADLSRKGDLDSDFDLDRHRSRWDDDDDEFRAEVNGGGISIRDATPTLMNNTFYGNTGVSHGGAIAVEGTSAVTVTARDHNAVPVIGSGAMACAGWAWRST